VIASLLAMHVSADRRKSATRMLDEMRDGWRYVWDFAPTRTVLMLLALVSTMGMPYMVLMPAVAEDILHGGAHTLGFLMTASGVGALIGALYLATRASVMGLGRAIAIAAMVFGAGLAVFSLSHVLWLSLLLLPIVGGGFMVQTASTNTILQTIVPEHLRGRVMAFYAMAFLGTAPIGSLVAGVVADRIGVPWTIFMGGIACIGGGILFWLRLPKIGEMIRPIYEERGIIPAGVPKAEAEAI
jgi:MFS family permease